MLRTLHVKTNSHIRMTVPNADKSLRSLYFAKTNHVMQTSATAVPKVVKALLCFMPHTLAQ